MDNFLAARAQMAFSLGFHMLFAATGVGMPLLTLIAEGFWLRTRQPHYLGLARTWSRVTGLLFALGAVSGTALSFEALPRSKVTRRPSTPPPSFATRTGASWPCTPRWLPAPPLP